MSQPMRWRPPLCHWQTGFPNLQADTFIVEYALRTNTLLTYRYVEGKSCTRLITWMMTYLSNTTLFPVFDQWP
jgi:hypothetical protein